MPTTRDQDIELRLLIDAIFHKYHYDYKYQNNR